MPKGIPKSGSRKSGAGRKQSALGPTTTVSFRVPVSKKEEIKELVKSHLNNVCTGGGNWTGYVLIKKD
jgi:hypothetical protein